MTLQSDTQEIKKLGSNGFHTMKPLHSVPVKPRWPGGYKDSSGITRWVTERNLTTFCPTPKTVLLSLRWGTQMTLHSYSSCSGLHPLPRALCPEETLEAAGLQWLGKVTWLAKKTSQIRSHSSKLTSFYKNSLQLIISQKYKIGNLNSVRFWFTLSFIIVQCLLHCKGTNITCKVLKKIT